MPDDAQIAIELVYCSEIRHHVLNLTLSAGATVADAIRFSGLSSSCPEIDASSTRVGVHGRIVSRDTVLSDGDRVEIYRPLIADPKQARRRRALNPR
jgi:putative ubiquitin-RnfH superfamily antitoxin RatB of RatAB toxin-antitoxin module